jgi:hypothetical protein
MFGETSLNRKFYTGKPISYGSDELQAEDVPQYVASNMGIFGNLYDLLSGRKGAGESAFNLFNPVTKINHVGQ